MAMRRFCPWEWGIAVVVGCALGFFRWPWWIAPIVGFVIGAAVGAGVAEQAERETGSGVGIVAMGYAILALAGYAVERIAKSLVERFKARQQ